MDTRNPIPASEWPVSNEKCQFFLKKCFFLHPLAPRGPGRPPGAPPWGPRGRPRRGKFKSRGSGHPPPDNLNFADGSTPPPRILFKILVPLN